MKKHHFIAVVIFIMLSFMAYESIAAPGSRSANRECATCHIMWLSEFKQKETETLIPYDPKPVVKTGKQDVASTEDICFSCHDGFVLDSRAYWEPGKHAHPVGQKPSENVSIPIVDGKNIFPLNNEGRMYCGTCHTAHGVDWEDKESAVFMRVRNVDGKLCMACHKNKTHGPETGSHPVMKKVHHKPEGLLKAGAKFGSNDEVVCQSCHKPHAAPEEKILRVENKKSELCGQCHDDRYGQTMADAASMKTHPVNIKPQHAHVAKELINAGAKQGQQKEVICQSCHRPHDARSKKGLLVKNNQDGALCQTCHVEKTTVLNSKHDMRLVEKDAENIRGQKVKDHGACSACHVPHKGNGAKMWARPVDKTLAEKAPMAALCLSCHNKDGLAKKHTVGEYSHPVGVDVKRLGHKVPLPTFDEKGLKWQDVMQGRVSCASCHDPHQWDPNDKHHKAQPGDEGDNTNKFLRIANNAEAALCKTCHKEKWNIAGTKHNMRIMAPDAKNTQGQTVDESGLCGVCHLVHNANGSKLWARDDLSGKGTGFVACIGCHNENGLAKKKTLGEHTHPLNVDIKRLGIKAEHGHWQAVDGSLATKPGMNKHELHVLPLYDENGHPAEQNGRVGCGTCHDPHNWTPDAGHTEDKDQKNKSPDEIARTEGDMNSSFLRIQDKGGSKLCVNCHVDKQSVFFTKHDLSDQQSVVQKPETSAENQKEVTSSGNVKGTCFHCHQPHNGKSIALWAQQPGESKSPVGRLCTSCHQKDKIAGKKLPGDHTHPVAKSMGDLSAHDKLPLYDENGHKTAGADRVDCTSCHNPHQWDPNDVSNRSLPMLGEEGDASNSFLRITADLNSELCVTCHADKKTIFGTDHDFDKKSVNSLNQKRDVSGLCGQCHVPHQGESVNYLWAQPLGEGQDAIERRCRSCHAELKSAAHKNPKQGQHPVQVKVWSTTIRQMTRPNTKIPDIRTFDENGKQNLFGSISCASCHNPHQWSAAHKASATTGKQNLKTEGNVLTSFLRNNETKNIVCADCHDGDGLYRYKYFHSDNTHPSSMKPDTDAIPDDLPFYTK